MKNYLNAIQKKTDKNVGLFYSQAICTRGTYPAGVSETSSLEVGEEQPAAKIAAVIIITTIFFIIDCNKSYCDYYDEW